MMTELGAAIVLTAVLLILNALYFWMLYKSDHARSRLILPAVPLVLLGYLLLTRTMRLGDMAVEATFMDVVTRPIKATVHLAKRAPQAIKSRLARMAHGHKSVKPPLPPPTKTFE